MVDSTSTLDIPANKLIDSLDQALLDPQVMAVDLIPISPGSPEDKYYPFVIGGGCLGIPLIAVCPVLEAAWGQVVAGPSDASHLNKLTRCIVALNPDHHTAWNRRKTLLQSGEIVYDDELRFLDLLVTYKRHCKASLVWHHRRWIIERCDINADAKVRWKAETKITSECCVRYPRNYHCWAYRWWMHQHISSTHSINELDRLEVQNMLQWTADHPADYAAYHYFHLLVDSAATLGSGSDVRRAIAQTECDTTAKLLRSVYSGYESVWHHRRWSLEAVAPITRATVQAELCFANNIARIYDGDEQVADLARKHVSWVRSSSHADM